MVNVHRIFYLAAAGRAIGSAKGKINLQGLQPRKTGLETGGIRDAAALFFAEFRAMTDLLTFHNVAFPKIQHMSLAGVPAKSVRIECNFELLL